jgi:hypothetical protein
MNRVEASRLLPGLFAVRRIWMNVYGMTSWGTANACSGIRRMDPVESLILRTEVTEALRGRARVVADADAPENACDDWQNHG